MVGYIICDIETDSLQPSLIHVICCLDTNTNTYHTFTSDPSMGEELLMFTTFVENNKDTNKFVFHGGINFDLPVINKFIKKDLLTVDMVEDTLILSRMLDVYPIDGLGHSLGAWGQRLNCPKIEFHEYELLTQEMIDYCKGDISTGAKTFEHLKKELIRKKISRKSIDLEYCVQELITQQENNGFKLDIPKAMQFVASLEDKADILNDRLIETFKPVPIFDKDIKVKYIKATGELSKVGLNHYRNSLVDVVGDHSRIKFQEFNPSSRQQIAERLIKLGWKPTKFTEKGNVIVDEGALANIDIPEANILKEKMLLEKRITQAASWIDAVDDNDRVHGKVFTLGAVSTRMTHNSPNMAQVPASYSPYGPECRQLWIPEEPNVLLGCDASGLELRVLAHYLNDPVFTKEVLDGDIHTANQKAAGLSTRDEAKTFIYAFLYGAGPAKIGSIVGGSAKDGQRLIDLFLKNVPALAALKHKLSIEIKTKKGWIRGLDGRLLKVRSEHSALNLLCQGAGAIICKAWLVGIFRLNYDKLPFKLVASIHDEYQFEVHPDHAEELGSITRRAIKDIEQQYNVLCPLDSEFKIGANWSLTH